LIQPSRLVALLLEQLEVLRVVVEKLLGEPGVIEMQRGSHRYEKFESDSFMSGQCIPRTGSCQKMSLYAHKRSVPIINSLAARWLRQGLNPRKKSA
jgi:hypothetical protein